MFQWNREMSIDDGFIDADHQKLIEIANRIAALDPLDYDQEELKQAVRELYDYIRYHFTREVNFMQDIGFDGMQSHQKAHRRIVKEMNHHLTHAHHMGEMLENFQTLMETWIMEHIMVEDIKLRDFLRTRQGQA